MLLNNYKNQGNKSTRLGFGDALFELGQQKPNIVALCADLTTSLCMNKFANTFSHRFFQIGIAEANMMGIAAGLSIGGFIPFTGTFANFSTSRVYDQIRQSICYSKKNVKICASHAGLTLGEDGATHQSLEDIGLMKMLPQLVVINTCDYNQTYLATFAIAEYYGPVYLRFGRPAVPNFTDKNQKFKIGQAQILIYGTDITIIATGHLVWEAIEAAHELYKEGISSEVINIHTIKPLDITTILTSVAKTGCIISAEEHNYWGGMGESIARILTTNLPIPQEFIAVNDSFGESGTPSQLIEKYKINKNTIKKKVKLLLKRKINK